MMLVFVKLFDGNPYGKIRLTQRRSDNPHLMP
jgi:hypothetical protein